MSADFFTGLGFWVRGWRLLLNQRRLLAVALLPLLIALFSTASLLWLLYSYLPQWAHGLVAWLGLAQGMWHDLLYYPMVVSAGILAFISSVYVMYILQNLIAVPFYSLLADRTLSITGKQKDGPWVWRQWLARSLKMLRVSVLKAVLLLAIGCVLFLFSFLPLLNVLAFACALLILAFDCMDYAFEAQGYGFRQRLAYLFREWPQWAGMGAGLGLTLFVPGLTLLVIPGAVVGAAIILKEGKK